MYQGIQMSWTMSATAFARTGMISNLFVDDFFEEVNRLANIDKVAAVMVKLLDMKMFDTLDGRRIFPSFMSDYEKFYSLGRYVGMVFFNSVIGAIYKVIKDEKREIFSKEKFATFLKDFPPEEMRREYAACGDEPLPTTYHFSKRQDTNVVKLKHSKGGNETGEKKTSSEANFCLLISAARDRVIIHDGYKLPVKGYEVLASNINLALGEDEEASTHDPETENTVLGMILYAMESTGFIVRRLKRNGFISGGGCPPGGPFEIEEPDSGTEDVDD
jgi:hypothetical protein